MKCTLKDSKPIIVIVLLFYSAVRVGLTFVPEQWAVSNQTSLWLVFLDILCVGFVSQIKDLDSSAISKQNSAPGRSVNIL